MKNLTFTELRDNLMHMREMRHDVVLNSADIGACDDGSLLMPEVKNVLTDHGVGVPTTVLKLNDHAMNQLATKWKIPTKYLRELASAPEYDLKTLWQQTVMTHMHSRPMDVLVRGLVEPGAIQGDCRAIMSPAYGFAEHFDVLTAVFDGLRTAREIHKVDFEPGVASISDTHMRARVNMPGLRVAADALLKDYKSPYSGNRGIDNPNLFLGIEIRNSEVGAGSFNIVPVIVIEVCNNGMTMTKELFRKVHLGARMDQGQISERTVSATMNLISSQTTDYVMGIASPEYLQSKVDELMGLTVTVQPSLVQEHLTNAYSDIQANAIFDAFIMGGDMTAFGVAQAMTAASQTDVFSADDAREIDDNAIAVAEQVAKLVA